MTTAIPTGAAELEEMLGDPGKLSALAGEPGKFAEFITAYTRSVHAKDESISVQIKEQVQAGLADLYRANGTPEAVRPNVTPSDAARLRPGAYNPEAPGAVLDGKFKSMSELVANLGLERRGDRPAAERLGRLRNDFSSSVPSEGGFLVPEEFRAQLLQTALEDSVVRQHAVTVPMAVPRISYPALDDTNHTGGLFGGVIGYWAEESAALTASSAAFGRITLDAAKLTAYTEVPNELIADSAISIGPLIDTLFPRALRWYEDIAFISGTGVGQPLGFLNAAATVTVSKEASQAADTILWANIVKMYARMLPSSLGSAVWVINQTAFPTLAQMTIPVKNVAGTENVGGSPVLVAATDGKGNPVFTILGRPVQWTEKVPAVGDLGDINFVDLSYYLIGDRQQMTAMTSEHFKFNTDTTAYRIIERLDGRPWLQNPVTPKNGDTLSPFVKLEAR